MKIEIKFLQLEVSQEYLRKNTTTWEDLRDHPTPVKHKEVYIMLEILMNSGLIQCHQDPLILCLAMIGQVKSTSLAIKMN